ncbi:MAG: hypothetical protein ACYDDU_13540 [Dermatophilaceae bacterium]
MPETIEDYYARVMAAADDERGLTRLRHAQTLFAQFKPAFSPDPVFRSGLN